MYDWCLEDDRIDRMRRYVSESKEKKNQIRTKENDRVRKDDEYQKFVISTRDSLLYHGDLRNDMNTSILVSWGIVSSDNYETYKKNRIRELNIFNTILETIKFSKACQRHNRYVSEHDRTSRRKMTSTRAKDDFEEMNNRRSKLIIYFFPHVKRESWSHAKYVRRSWDRSSLKKVQYV